MNLNGLVLNLSPSGLCVHLVVELQPAAERKPHHKSPHHQSQPGKEPASAKKKLQTCPPKKKQQKIKKHSQTRAEK